MLERKGYATNIFTAKSFKQWNGHFRLMVLNVSTEGELTEYFVSLPYIKREDCYRQTQRYLEREHGIELQWQKNVAELLVEERARIEREMRRKAPKSKAPNARQVCIEGKYFPSIKAASDAMCVGTKQLRKMLDSADFPNIEWA